MNDIRTPDGKLPLFLYVCENPLMKISLFQDDNIRLCIGKKLLPTSFTIMPWSSVMSLSGKIRRLESDWDIFLNIFRQRISSHRSFGINNFIEREMKNKYILEISNSNFDVNNFYTSFFIKYLIFIPENSEWSTLIVGS